MSQVFKSGATAPKGSNFFLNVGLLMGLAFALSGGSAMFVLMSDITDSSPTGPAMTSDGEVVMLNTATGKILNFGITVPNSDIKNVKLDLTGDIVTYYSNGAFKTYDISDQQSKDSFTPSHYDPSTDTYKSNGHQLAVYSSGTNSLTIRDTVGTNPSSGHSMKVVPGPSTRALSTIMASDGNAFYWAANTFSDSVVYKYDQATNSTTVVKKLGFKITELSAGSGHVAYSYNVSGESQIMVLDTSTGNSRHLCGYCSMPRMSGSVVAALGQGTVLVQNVSSGKHQDIKEDREVQDIRVDGDKVGWSWVQQVDPITVKDLRTGKEITYEPDHVVYTFAMSGDRILMVRSKALLPPNPLTDVNLQFSGNLAGVFLFGTVIMFGMAFMLNRQRTKETKEAYAREWAAYWQKSQAEGIQNYYQYPSTPGCY